MIGQISSQTSCPGRPSEPGCRSAADRRPVGVVIEADEFRTPPDVHGVTTVEQHAQRGPAAAESSSAAAPAMCGSSRGRESAHPSRHRRPETSDPRQPQYLYPLVNSPGSSPTLVHHDTVQAKMPHRSYASAARHHDISKWLYFKLQLRFRARSVARMRMRRRRAIRGGRRPAPAARRAAAQWPRPATGPDRGPRRCGLRNRDGNVA